SGAQGSAQATLNVAGTAVPKPDPDAHGIVATLTPAQASAGQGTSAQYTIQVTNTGSAEDRYTLQVNGLPNGISYAFDQNYQNHGDIDVPPGASNFRDVGLSLAVSAGTAPGNYPFTVVATSENNDAVTDSTGGTLTVTANGVSVTLDKTSGAPGD